MIQLQWVWEDRMKRTITTAVFFGVVMLAGAPVALASGELWSYDGETGPDNWGELTQDWAVCGNGRYQSPINLTGGVSANLGSIKADIKSSPLKFGLDGPTFAVPYQPGSTLSMNGTRYELQQFHFHHRSEHTVDGKYYPLEAHLVLRSEGSDHNDAVMGVFIEAGSENAMLNQFWNQLPRSNQKPVNPVPVNVGDLLPKQSAYFMYEGSMTTPGCPQGVRWFVIEQPVQAAQAQIDKFIADFTEGKTNNRPIQPTYGRAILKGK
jgi:carbonic anhydrase